MIFIPKEYTIEDCVRILQEKQTLLLSNSENRFPKRSDFSDREVIAIKSHLGPWPRALEAAGLKRKNDIPK